MKTLKKKISAVYEAERNLMARTKELLVDIVDNINDTNMDGVTMIDGPIKCATVSFKTISTHKTNLSPTFYISDYQIQALREKINSFTTLNEVKTFIDTALQDRHVKIKGEKIILNPAVMEKLVSIQNMF